MGQSSDVANRPTLCDRKVHGIRHVKQ